MKNAKRIYFGKGLNRNKPPKTMSYEERINFNKELAEKVRAIGHVVADYNGTTLQAINVKTRTGGVLLIRQIIHKICREITTAPLWIIGKEIGNKDHATCLNSVKAINNYIDSKNRFVIDIYESSKRAAQGCINKISIPNPILDPIFLHNMNHCPQF